MVTPKSGRSFRRDVNAQSSALRTIERTSAIFRFGLRSDHLHNNTVFYRKDSLSKNLQENILRKVQESASFQNSFSLDFSNWIKGASASSFFKYYLYYVAFRNGWEQLRSSNKVRLNLKQCFLAIQIVEKRGGEDLKRPPLLNTFEL